MARLDGKLAPFRSKAEEEAAKIKSQKMYGS